MSSRGSLSASAVRPLARNLHVNDKEWNLLLEASLLALLEAAAAAFRALGCEWDAQQVEALL